MIKFLACILCGLAPLCIAGTLQVNIQTKTLEAMPNAVVYLTSEVPVHSTPPTEAAIMDQVNSQFSPHILAVQKDTKVLFPNSDSIKHHVYSFSPTQIFELQLYKGLKADPLMFSKAGIVELGCNVHDWMLGYIMVVDSPYFSQTNAKGHASIEAPDGNYTLHLWHPQIKEDDSDLSQKITVKGNTSATFSLKTELLPGHGEYEDSGDEFSGYE